MNTAVIVSEDHHLSLRGRSKDMIVNATGYNVYAAEVEDVLLDFPSVVEASVVAVCPDRESGFEEVCAFVVMKDGDGRETSECLKKHCSTRLADYKVPSHFRFLKALPRNRNYKVLKRELSDSFIRI